MLPAFVGVVAMFAPPGYELVFEAPGVRVHRGEPGWHVVEAELGVASLESVVGDVTGVLPAAGGFGGATAALKRHTAAGMWERAHERVDEPVVLVNGVCFSPSIDPTSVSFPLAVDGDVLSEGYGTTSEYPNETLMLGFDRDAAVVQPAEASALYAPWPTDHVGGLAITADKRPDDPLGRTFVGLYDGDGDGQAEQLLVLVAGEATQAEAAATLTAFGATSQIMLCGGGTSFIWVDGVELLQASRAVPHALVIGAGSASSDQGPVRTTDGGTVTPDRRTVSPAERVSGEEVAGGCAAGGPRPTAGMFLLALLVYGMRRSITRRPEQRPAVDPPSGRVKQ